MSLPAAATDIGQTVLYQVDWTVLSNLGGQAGGVRGARAQAELVAGGHCRRLEFGAARALLEDGHVLGDAGADRLAPQVLRVHGVAADEAT